MRIEIKMPQWGMGQDEGTVQAWIVSVGDSVSEGDVVASIETAKVDGEVEAPATGVLAEIIISEGETVTTGTVLAVIETSE